MPYQKYQGPAIVVRQVLYPVIYLAKVTKKVNNEDSRTRDSNKDIETRGKEENTSVKERHIPGNNWYMFAFF